MTRPPLPTSKLPTEHECSFTVLRTRGPLLTKRVRSGLFDDPVFIDYDEAKYFRAASFDVATLDQVAALLFYMAPQPYNALVAGAIATDADRCYMRRLKNSDPKTGDAATLYEIPRRLAILDLDAVPCPEGFDRRNLTEAARIVREALPTAFRKAACVALASSGYGLKPGLRFRLFFFLQRSLEYPTLKLWLQHERAPVDCSPMHAAGLHYTATPIFEGGAVDPLPGRRLVRLDGADRVAVPSSEKLAGFGPSPKAAPKTQSMGGLKAPADRILQASGRPFRIPNDGGSPLITASAIVHGAEKGQRHNAMINAALVLVPAVIAGRISEGMARCCLASAAKMAVPDRWSVDEEANRVFDWAMQRAQTASEERQRRIDVRFE